MGCDHSKLESFGRTSQAYYSKFKRFSDDPQACCCKLLKRYGNKLARRWPTTKTQSVDAHIDLSDDEQYHDHDHHHQDFGDDHGEEYPSHDHRAHSFGADTNVPKDGGGWYQGGHEHNILRPHTNLDKGKDIMTDDEPPKQPSWHHPKAEYFSHTCDKSLPNSYDHHSQQEDLVHNPFQKLNPSTYHSQPHDFYHNSGRKGGISFNAGQYQAYDYNLHPPHHSSGHGTTYNWMCYVPHNDCYCDYYRKPNPHTYDQNRNRHHPHGQSAKPQDLSWGEIFGHDPAEQFFAPSFYFN